jgi:hypothetical protein
MPRKRQKTDADLPTYRRPSSPPLPVPEDIEPFLAGVGLRRIAEQFGVANVQLVLEAIAKQERRELIERRSRETLDAWKAGARPMAATSAELIALPASDVRRLRRAIADTAKRLLTPPSASSVVRGSLRLVWPSSWTVSRIAGSVVRSSRSWTWLRPEGSPPRSQASWASVRGRWSAG